MPRRTPRFSISPPAPRAIINPNTGYDAKWKRLRDARLAHEPLCRTCTSLGLVTPAVEVDHIQPKALGGDDTWENTQSICKPCHQEKTREDIRRMRRGW